MPQRMIALYGGSGPTWQVREMPVPRPGPGQVLVRAHAVSLNNADVAVLDSSATQSNGQSKEYLAGYEFAGNVAETGPGVDTPLGERVMGTTQGAFAQYVLADHRHVMPMPASLGYEQGSALPTGLLTEHGALTEAGFAVGQSVLITGASSSIGLVGVQIAKALGARTVIATIRSDAKRALLEDAGADTVVVTNSQNLTQAVLGATGGDGVDVVLDHVGGQTFARCLAATRVDGHVINIGRLDRAQASIDLDALSYRHLHVRGVSFGFSRTAELGAVIAGLDTNVLPAVADGRIRPVIDSILSLEQAAEAADRIRTGQAQGKVVMSMP